LAARGNRAAGCHNRLILKQFLLLVGAFTVATLLALAFGAKNLGTALTFGQMAFAGTLVAVLLFAARPGTRGREE
jgi:hypothetical protein